jgi:hypothetical protein
MRTEFDEGAGPMLEGKLVEGTVVEGTVVDGTTVVDGNIMLEGETLGAEPATLLPPLALPGVGAEPTLLPNWLGGVPVMLGAGVAPYGEVVTVPGVVGDMVPIPGVVVTAPGAVAAAPGAAAPPPAPPTWANAGSAASVATKMNGKRRASNMSKSPCNQAE